VLDLQLSGDADKMVKLNKTEWTNLLEKPQVQTGFEVINGGMMGYAEALAMQAELCIKRQNDQIGNTVVVLEHPAVITLGARKSENKLLATPESLEQRGIQVVQVGRGGGTTAHNPGQAVAYPIIKLNRSLGLGVNEYVRTLEAIGIELLAGLGVEAQRRKGLPGLWIGERKIASIGVQIKKWVTFHGIAINICNDLEIFKLIVPCGLDGVTMTSALAETGRKPEMEAVKKILMGLCEKAFTRG
jgi:lipoate-protein ligase B